MKKTKAYWVFQVKVGTSNPAKPTEDMKNQILVAILVLPEVSEVSIEEKY